MVVNVFFSAVTQATMSRHDLLAWVNASLQANLTKIEEMSTGAAYCGLTDLLFPGSLPIKKVKWNSKSEVDYINNWNILQKAWKDIGVDKPVPVDRLLRAKFQENFEFLQWFKKFFDANWAEHEYDAVEARNGEDFPAALPGGSKGPAVAKVTAARTAPRPAPASTVPKAAPTKPAAVSRNAVTTKTSLVPSKSPKSLVSTGTNGTTSTAAVEAKYKQRIDELTAELTTLTETASTLEKERDFYFTKLRAVEILCQETGEGNQINIDKVSQILYELEDGFEPAENTELSDGVLDVTHDLTETIPKPEAVKDEKLEEHVENHNGGSDALHAVADLNLDDDQTF